MAALLGWLRADAGLLLNIAIFVAHLLVAARAITRPNRIPVSRVAWVAVIMFLPVVGMLAYLLLGETSIGRRRMRRLRKAEAALAAAAEPFPAGRPDATLPAPRVPVAVVPAAAGPLFDLAASINGFAAVGGNRIGLAADSNAAIDALVADVAAAREHVHLCFYIWLDDGNGGRVADAVADAARRGVACRVMVDALGSRGFVRSPRWRQLREAGVHLLATLDDIPRLGHLALGRMDLRNHRKIAVIDDRVCHCGSQNCADPEFRIKARYAPWVDLMFRCEGDVVRQAQQLFLATWTAETGERPERLPAAPPPPGGSGPGAVALMFGTGPTTRGNAMSDMFVAALYAARRELVVTTPYFVPDEAILRALCAAPRRGVRTTLILPARNDSRLVRDASRSCYEDLLASGIGLYEYPLGLLHAKSITIDGEVAMVGSANMDRRSLELNYENNLLVADRETVAAIRRRQMDYLAASRPVDLAAVRAWPFHVRLAQNAVGMLAPLL